MVAFTSSYETSPIVDSSITVVSFGAIIVGTVFSGSTLNTSVGFSTTAFTSSSIFGILSNTFSCGALTISLFTPCNVIFLSTIFVFSIIDGFFTSDICN